MTDDEREKFADLRASSEARRAGIEGLKYLYEDVRALVRSVAVGTQQPVEAIKDHERGITGPEGRIQ